MSDKHEVRKLLRATTPELVHRTLAGEISWPVRLHAGVDVIEITGLPAAVDESWRKVPTAEAWSGVALLANWAPTPFHIGDLPCASVESFYHSLKYPEGSAERARVAVLPGPEAQHRAAHRRASTFQFHGEMVAVNSPEHASVVAEAVVAKIAAHPEVGAALDATGEAELTFRYGLEGRNALAQGAPLALMIERVKRRHSPPN